MKRLVGRSRCEWDDNIKMELQKELDCVDWIQTTQDTGEWREFVKGEINL